MTPLDRRGLWGLAAALGASEAVRPALAQTESRGRGAEPRPRDGIAGYQPGMPFLLRGTVSARLWPGVTPGAGVGRAQRQRNLAGLQAALDHAVANRRFFELEPGLYEIEGEAGLRVPPTKDGFVWRGAKGSLLKQFADNAPVLTLGDVAGSREIQDMDLRGVRLLYDADQSDHARSSALRIGLMRNSTVEQVAVLAEYAETGPSVKAHRGIHITNASHAFGFFSNTVKDVMVGGAARSLLDIALVGTGSVFSNIYLTQGVTGSPQPIAGVPLRIAGTADLYETVFEQLNIEWCIANVLIHAQSCRSTTFLSTHLEGNRLAGWSPRVMTVATSGINAIGWNVLDQEIRRSEVTGGTRPSLFQCYGDCAITGSGMEIAWSAAGRVDIPFHLFSVSPDSPAGAQQAASVTNLSLRDAGGGNSRSFGLDAGVSSTGLGMSGGVARYTHHELLSEVEGARFRGNADATVFGDHHRPLLCFPAALGGRRVVTLSDRLKPQGVGGSCSTPAGALVGVLREAGQGDPQELTVRGHDGRVLGAIGAAAAGTTRWFRFDGRAWQPLG
jgi:hypothetical protein